MVGEQGRNPHGLEGVQVVDQNQLGVLGGGNVLPEEGHGSRAVGVRYEPVRPPMEGRNVDAVHVRSGDAVLALVAELDVVLPDLVGVVPLLDPDVAVELVVPNDGAVEEKEGAGHRRGRRGGRALLDEAGSGKEGDDLLNVEPPDLGGLEDGQAARLGVADYPRPGERHGLIITIGKLRDSGTNQKTGK